MRLGAVPFTCECWRPRRRLCRAEWCFLRESGVELDLTRNLKGYLSCVKQSLIRGERGEGEGEVPLMMRIGVKREVVGGRRQDVTYD